MAEARLLEELNQSKMEVARLKERLSVGTPTVYRDLSLISLVPKWSGSEAEVSLEEFIESIEATAKIGNWQEKDNCKSKF